MEKNIILRIIYFVAIVIINFLLMFLAAGEIDEIWVITEPLTSILGFLFVGFWLLTSYHLFKSILWKRK